MWTNTYRICCRWPTAALPRRLAGVRCRRAQDTRSLAAVLAAGHTVAVFLAPAINTNLCLLQLLLPARSLNSQHMSASHRRQSPGPTRGRKQHSLQRYSSFSDHAAPHFYACIYTIWHSCIYTIWHLQHVQRLLHSVASLGCFAPARHLTAFLTFLWSCRHSTAPQQNWCRSSPKTQRLVNCPAFK